MAPGEIVGIIDHEIHTSQIAAAERALKATQAGPPAKLVERVWIDDALPAGAQPFGNGGGPQNNDDRSQPAYIVTSNGNFFLAGGRDSGLTILDTTDVNITEYADSTAVPGVEYEYCVSAVDTSGTESAEEG